MHFLVDRKGRVAQWLSLQHRACSLDILDLDRLGIQHLYNNSAIGFLVETPSPKSPLSQPQIEAANRLNGEVISQWTE